MAIECYERRQTTLLSWTGLCLLQLLYATGNPYLHNLHTYWKYSPTHMHTCMRSLASMPKLLASTIWHTMPRRGELYTNLLLHNPSPHKHLLNTSNNTTPRRFGPNTVNKFKSIQSAMRHDGGHGVLGDEVWGWLLSHVAVSWTLAKYEPWRSWCLTGVRGSYTFLN